jgi:hypothetical protein
MGTIVGMTKRVRFAVSGGVLAVLIAAIVGWKSWEDFSRPSAAKNAPRPMSAVGRESMSLLAPSLTDVYLGMTQPELQATRPRAARQRKADEPQLFMLDEALSATERALYGIDMGNLQLAKVQIASRLSSVEEVAPRIALMQSRYGSPTGIYDCPAVPGQLPTRRFLFQRSALGVIDSYLMLGDQIAVTLYVAPMPMLQQSLTVARCAPAAKEALARFPAVPMPSK